jgi:hypothetical protein
MSEEKIGKITFPSALKECIEGAVTREPMLLATKERTSLETLFLLVIFGDTLGIPVPRSYYALTLLPHVGPRPGPWKRALLRQRDWTDFAFD